MASVSLAQILFPPRCPCGVVGSAPCYACWSSLRPCPSFSIPGLAGAGAAYLYEGAGGDLIRAFKYRNNRALLAWAATALVELVEASAPDGHGFDLVTWLPASRAGRSRRGFDQGALLGRSVAAGLRLPAGSTLKRSSRAAQTGQDRVHRMNGPALVAVGDNSLVGTRILLVDDVITTGSSMRFGASLLERFGVAEVYGIAVARAEKFA